MDTNILNFIHESFQSKFLDIIMPYITALGNGGILWIIMGLIFAFIPKMRKCGVSTLIALLFCLIIGNLTLKPLIARVRPFDVNQTIKLLITPPNDFSFPSGHTLASFATATSVFLYNKKTGVIIYCMAVLIAFSRLYLYLHYPTDVLAGVILGIIFGLLSRVITEKIFKMIANKKA